MRLQLALRAERPFWLSLNYQHFLTAVIYRLIAAASEKHATWLHDVGHVTGVRTFKHFTFSKLLLPNRPQIDSGRLLIKDRISWKISFCLPSSLEPFVVGLFSEQKFWLENPQNELRVETVESLPLPDFKSPMRMTCLSPILVKKPYKRPGEDTLRAEHLGPDHPECSEYLRRNLLEKSKSLNHPHVPLLAKEGERGRLDFRFLPDREYLKKRQGRVTKLITLYEGRPEETKNRAFECPFALEGPPELLRIAYESGLGNDNAMGFGMIEQV
jgi:CRISPR-associated endoribonuclease Cas6